MDRSTNKPAPKPEENPLMRPDHELPAPHDMLLEEGHSPVETPPKSHPTNTKKTFPLWILPLIALVLVLLAGGMYLMNNQKQTSPAEQAPAVTQIPTATPDPTANWEMYQSPVISFMYPPDWTISSSSAVISVQKGATSIDFLLQKPSIRANATYVRPLTEIQDTKSFMVGNQMVFFDFFQTKLTSTSAALSQAEEDLSVLYGIGILSDNALRDLQLETDTIMQILTSVTFPSQMTPIPSTRAVRPSASDAMVACTMDAKICPNGSSVGRTGPKCEFAACPK